jgi:Zn-dependent protease with chaperone function/uncharacterized RDD family membrane protein YckC
MGRVLSAPNAMEPTIVRATASELFAGPQSLRVPGERRSLWVCILCAPLVIGLVRLVFPSVSLSEFVLLIAGGLVFVSVGRGRLLGSSIRIEGRQFPEIEDLTRDLAARIGIPAPQVFVRDDPFVPIAAVGVGEPYALMISSQYYEHLRRGELAFLIARELGHIAAGHTRLTSLLSASGRENPVVALVFGAWLRRTELTADRVGFVCCDGIEDALGAISITTFHAIGRRVDMSVLAEQRSELQAEPALRVGEWIAGVPYATNRLEALRIFAEQPLATTWRERLEHASEVPVEAAGEDAGAVTRADSAPLVRRLCAAFIDFTVLSAILQTPVVVNVKETAVADPDVPKSIEALLRHMPTIDFGLEGFSVLLAFFIYSAILVGLVGQTLGMTVMDVRVVTTAYRRPTIVRSLWRYFLAFVSSLTAVAFIGLFTRIHPHDRVSGTRLVRARRAR